MIKLDQIKLPIGYSNKDLVGAVAVRLGVPDPVIVSAEVLKLSVDARHKPRLEYAAGVAVDLGEAESRFTFLNAAAYVPLPRSLDELALPASGLRAVVVGSGPAGMFAALALAKAGAKPIVIERGSDVAARTARVAILNGSGILDPDCNIQFGEGGAGTFSDGKLNTGTVSEFSRAILGELVRHGAPKEIEILAKPHVGTDYLARVVENIRREIEGLGGTYLFDTKLTGLKIRNGRVTAAIVEGKNAGEIECEALLLGVGHSARDTYRMLYGAGANMEQKMFAVGVRAEHLQSVINVSQYGTAVPPFAADYKLAANLSDGRGVFTFCMCPGGSVVCSASEEGGVVTNGMSEFARAGRNANAAILVGVGGRDFGEELFAGVEFQRGLERAAYAAGGGGYRAPAQRYGDFMRKRASTGFGRVTPTYLPGVTPADLHAVLPPSIATAIGEGIAAFAKKLKGFDDPDTLLTGVETRTSSPIRILRDERGESNLKGLYPIGEGAGYAGGIMSAAADGLRAAVNLIRQGT